MKKWLGISKPGKRVHCIECVYYGQISWMGLCRMNAPSPKLEKPRPEGHKTCTTIWPQVSSDDWYREGVRKEK